MNITYTIQTDLAHREVRKVISAVQGDTNTRSVKVALLSGGTVWPVPAGTSVSVAFRNLKDGHKGWYDKLPDGSDACTVSGNVVTAILAPAVLSGDGEVQAAIVFQDAQLNQLATFGFSILVEKNPAAGAELHNDYYAYTTLGAINEAVEAALDALETAEDQMRQQVNQAVADMQEDLETGKAQLQQEAGPAIVCEASGAEIAVQDASDRPLQGLTIYGKTTQNGTPTPDAPVQLESAGVSGSIGVTVAGKNLFDLSSATAETVDASGAVLASDGALLTDYIAVSAQYVTASGTLLEGQTNSSAYRVIGYDANKNFIGRIIIGNAIATFDVSGYAYIRFCTFRTEFDVNTLQLEFGTTATAYEPYKGQTATFSTPDGLHGIGEVCDEIDLARGVRVQKFKAVTFDGSEDFTFIASLNQFNLRIADMQPTPSNDVSLKAKCNAYRVKTYSEGNNVHGSICAVGGVNGIRIINYDYTEATLADFKASMKGVTFVYELATPTETPLSAEELAAYAALHTNKPNTTVYNDAGAFQSVTYVADTKTYIDRKFTELQSAIVAAGANI